jgi:hypothetical protein
MSELIVIPKGALSMNVKREQFGLATDNQQETSLTQFQCHGGIPIYLKKESRCLCLPTIYDLRCENENQRV